MTRISVAAILSCSIVLASVERLPAQQAQGSEAAATNFPIPPNLVIDLRLFESRTEYPDDEAMDELRFFIQSDGRSVTADQWLSTVAKKVPDTFLAALGYDTVPVENGVSHFEWSKGSRKIVTEIRIEGFHPAAVFQAQLKTTLMRGSRVLSELTSELNFQMSRTLVWSSSELKLSASDYLSHFREYEDRDHRGLLYERLRAFSFYLVMAATPRVLTEDEVALGPRETLTMPPDAVLPTPPNPFGVTLQGSIVLGFEVGPGGEPVNPQVLRSTLPEANPWIVQEASDWRFPDSQGLGQVEVKLHIDAESPSETDETESN